MSEPTATRGEERTDVGSVFVSNYPPYSAWTPSALGEVERALASPPAPDTPLGLYLHIPFCRVRCKFCYYKVYTDMDSARIRSYLSALAAEVRILGSRPAVAGRPLRFVYFGGGTPSYISVKDLRRLVEEVRSEIPWEGAEEITFECEPGTLTEAKLAALRDIGVTRLSLGVESFDDGLLEENGRAHLSAEIHRSIPWIRGAGFDQFNIDLIAGMVGETWDTWRDSVQKTIDLAPDSVTIYQMELPFNTVYSKDLLGRRREIALAGWDLKRAWHGWAYEQLEQAGYEVIDAYTAVKKGRGCRFVYREALWRGADMLGTGVASFSHVGGVHFQNTSEWDEYLARLGAGELPLSRAFATTPAHRLTRELILQLKLGGLDPAYFARKFGADILAEHAQVFARLAEQGMLTFSADRVELTRQGLLRADSLLPEFYAPEYRNTRYT